MKRLSEVTKITGVSRRALQEYDKIGLVNPSAKTEGGYWLYDDDSIQKILFIQTFVEVGYERKKIKELLDAPALDVVEEFDKVIGLLEIKRRHVDGMIKLVKTWKGTATLPATTLRAFSHMDYVTIYQDRTYSDVLKNSVEEASKLSEEDIRDAEKYSPFYYHLLAIGCLKKLDPRTKAVQNCVHNMYRYFFEMANEDEKEEDKLTEAELYSEKIATEFVDMIKNDILTDQDIASIVISQCGQDAIGFIGQSVDVFKKLVMKNYWNKKDKEF